AWESSPMPDLPDLRRKWLSVGPFWPIVAAGCFGLVVAVSAWFAVSIWKERLAKAKFNNVAGDYPAVLQTGLDTYLSKIVAVRAFYEASVEVDPDEFKLFTSQILDGQSNRMRVIWCPYVTREGRAAFERKQIGRGFEGYAIKNWIVSGDPPIAPEREECFPVLCSTVASKAQATLGMDLNSEPTRSRAIQFARDNDVVATAQDIMLRNPIGGARPGFFFVTPVYRTGAPIGTMQER